MDKFDPEDDFDQVMIEEPLKQAMGLIDEPLRKKERKQQRRFLETHTPQESKPQYYPHFRRAHDYGTEEGDGQGDEQAKQPSNHFFSRKPWDAVDGMFEDVVETTNRLELPRPSRIQNLCFYDIAKGRHTVIADQAGSGKTLAYMLPLFQRYLSDSPPATDGKVKIVVLAPTSDLVEQVTNVARVLSYRSGTRLNIECCTGGRSVANQRGKLKRGTDILVATPGRFGFLAAQDTKQVLDLSECHAIVMDEVDVLLHEEAQLGIAELRELLPPRVQWVFVTATLGAEALSQLSIFKTSPSLRPAPDNDAQRSTTTPRAALVWHTGPGLHKISPNCEHVLIDCTPNNFMKLPSNKRHAVVMRNKILALAWHLNYGILKKDEDHRLVVFCNTIDNCRFVENELRKLNTKDKRIGARRLKVMVLHGLRTQEAYMNIVKEFQDDRGPARDFGKKKVLVCTDRLSRGMDFKQQAIPWVILMDWPRDATEYIRRVGRTCRGGANGGVMSLTAGWTELKMAKKVTSAAIRGVPLDSTKGRAANEALLNANTHCLELFDPTAADWRSPEASARRPRAEEAAGEEAPEPGQLEPDERDLTEEQQEQAQLDQEQLDQEQQDQEQLDEEQLDEELFDEIDSRQNQEATEFLAADRQNQEAAEFLAAEKQWEPWKLDADDERPPWEDEDFLEDDDYFEDDPYDSSSLRVGVSLDD